MPHQTLDRQERAFMDTEYMEEGEGLETFNHINALR